MEHAMQSNYTNKDKTSFEAETQSVTGIELRLSNWAKWAKVQRNYGLGFPGESPISKLMREGASCHKVYNSRIPDNPNAEKTEAAIREMPEHLSCIIEQYYLRSGSVQQKARELSMSRVTFYEHLRMAKYWLLGKWS